ncbi:MAG: hypothetical protein CBB67_021815 [Alteromonadaceae bacterium TMED7]|uniref:Solute-binding protein family 3/N-terminal domain-containing protein n=1 Tax=Alteromonas alba TaxID=2079529 RepID=A0A2S9V5B3_9ALTE|nr:hypothetical protein [Alteromonas alba]PRO71639.1 hypothetical protein C6Y40_21150 [Alteromonas alba]RPH12990.1 MAG: hypothetical protein CBB67_021815 [Alteromonadaceae bacterium TMED7]|tara:strand:- start:8030 stop:8899 length:870 start_codon:yes stop_codon:yes gene_type:complete
MMRKIVLLILIFIGMRSVYGADDIVVWHRTYEKIALIDIIEMAAKLSEPEFGPYTIRPSRVIEQGRAFISLAEGELLNVMVAGISSERERLGLPIYVPLDRGLLGFRVCLQNKTARSLKKITSLTDFMNNRIVVGVGSHWPDREILEYNGLKVMHSPVYEQLFPMLHKGRFDCFLRSMHEVDQELVTYQEYELQVDKYISIIYPQADFAFVSVNHPRIHKRLQLGLKKAIAQGLFSEHFEKYYAATLKEHNLYGRKLIILENPDLSIEAFDAINEYGLASFALNVPKRP